MWLSLFLTSILHLPFGLFRSFAADTTTLTRPFVAKATEEKCFKECKKNLESLPNYDKNYDYNYAKIVLCECPCL